MPSRAKTPPCRASSQALAAMSALTAFLVLAVGARLVNLGTFSMWLDEILTMHIAAGTLGDVLRASAADAENVPLYAVLMWGFQQIGIGELAARICLSGLAVVGLLMFARWIALRLGLRAGVVALGFGALSPFHVRYSQELRAYPILLFVVAGTFLAAEYCASTDTRLSIGVLSVCVAVGSYTHLSYCLIIPAVLAISADPIAFIHDRKTRLLRTTRAILLGLIPFVPWLVVIARALAARADRGGTDWTMGGLLVRWHALTAAGREGDAATIWSVMLFGVFAVGLTILLRSPRERWIALSLSLSLVGWEVLLAAVRHWSDARYDTAVWYLIPYCLAATGASFWDNRSSVVFLLCTTLMLAPLIPGLWSYWRRGRPHWDLMADSLGRIVDPSDVVIATNEWVRVCLSRYAQQHGYKVWKHTPPGPTCEHHRVFAVSGGLMPDRIAPPSQCESRILASLPQTGRIEQWVAKPHNTRRGSVEWSTPTCTVIPPIVTRSIGPRETLGFAQDATPGLRDGCWTVTFRPEVGESFSRSGLAKPEPGSEGGGFSWILGGEGCIGIPGELGPEIAGEVAIRPFWAAADDQEYRLFLDGEEAVRGRLTRGVNRITFNGSLRDDRQHLFTIQFSDSWIPANAKSDSTDKRALSAALHQLKICNANR